MVYKDIISTENLLHAWNKFVKGKKYKKDVAEFSLNLLDNIFMLHDDLRYRRYRHSQYEHFKIADPKPRDIHKATVRDRVLHCAICSVINPHFDKKFIYDCYSSRDFKGTHRAIERFTSFYRKVSKNNTRTCWVLKCDIKKFFATIDHDILLKILRRHIEDEDINSLIQEIVSSFHTTRGKGLPLGNLTSQLLVNIYMNAFDQFMKHDLKVKYYIRYADDFVLLSEDKEYLENALVRLTAFLKDSLKLTLHPKKVSIDTFKSGVDFLGWINFGDHKVLRTTTKKRLLQGVKGKEITSNTVSSYVGLLKHGNGYKIMKQVGGLTKKLTYYNDV